MVQCRTGSFLKSNQRPPLPPRQNQRAHKPNTPPHPNQFQQKPRPHRGTMPPRVNPQFQNQQRKVPGSSHGHPGRPQQYAPHKFQSNKVPYQTGQNQSFSSQKNRHPQNGQFRPGFVPQRNMPPGNPRQMNRNKANTHPNKQTARFVKSNSNPLALNVRNQGPQRPNFSKIKSNGKEDSK